MSHHTNLVRLRSVATALAELNERAAFVGGSTVSLYATHPAATEVRPTDDVDVVIEVTTYTEFTNQIEERLRQLGFTNDVTSGIICRYLINGLVVDVMPPDSAVLGFTNRWYTEGMSQTIRYPVSDQQTIRIFSAPYFLATKFEAFKSERHGRDPRMDSDFEDIIYVFDNRTNLGDEIKQSPESVRSYLQAELKVLLSSDTVEELVYSHLERRTAGPRAQRILTIWSELIKL